MKHLRAVLLLLLLAVLAVPAQAAEADWDGTAAEAVGFPSPQRLTDGDRGTYTTAQEGAAVTLSRSGGISARASCFSSLPPSGAVSWLV